MRKAYTAAMLRITTAQMGAIVERSPGALGLMSFQNMTALGGGLPIRVGDEVVGGIGVAGVPVGGAGGAGDEGCARIGLDRIIARIGLLSDAIRPARDDDAQDLFGLLALCFAEHPGCFVDPHDDLADLRRPSRVFAETAGALWVVEDERGRIAASVALDMPAAGTAELHRLYVRPDRRRAGLGQRLVAFAEAEARRRGASRLVFWSDTRFAAAHRLYGRLGFVRTGGERVLGDISNSVEAGFAKRLD